MKNRVFGRAFTIAPLNSLQVGIQCPPSTAVKGQTSVLACDPHPCQGSRIAGTRTPSVASTYLRSIADFG